MITRINHIGIAVKNLKAALDFYRDALGLEACQEISWPGLRAALIPTDNILIELIEPVGEPQIRVAESLCKIVNEQGGGVHHLAVEVDDIEGMLDNLKGKGLKLIDQMPQQQAGGKIAWLHEETVDGFMIELCEEGYQVT